MKNWMTWICLASAAGCAASGAGGGTETDNPAALQRFDASECKSRAPEPAQQALARASEREGLQCVEWSREADALRVSLTNFAAACGDAYRGRAELAKDGALELSVYRDSCEVLRCGSCLYDFDFVLEGALDDGPVTLRLGAAACEAAAVEWQDTLELPLDTQPSGARCRYVSRGPLEQYARARGTCGARHMPCGDCSDASAVTCADELSCSEVADVDRRCLASCRADDDCGGVTTCVDGLCHPQRDW